MTLVAGGIWTWLGHREEAAQRALGQALADGSASDWRRASLRSWKRAADGAPPVPDRAIPSGRASGQAWYVLGQVEFRRSQWDAAIAAFAEASRRDRGSIGRLSRLGQGYAYEAKGDAARALEVYQQALGRARARRTSCTGTSCWARPAPRSWPRIRPAPIATYKQYVKDLPSADRVQDVRIRLALLGSAG